MESTESKKRVRNRFRNAVHKVRKHKLKKSPVRNEREPKILIHQGTINDAPESPKHQNPDSKKEEYPWNNLTSDKAARFFLGQDAVDRYMRGRDPDPQYQSVRKCSAESRLEGLFPRTSSEDFNSPIFRRSSYDSKLDGLHKEYLSKSSLVGDPDKIQKDKKPKNETSPSKKGQVSQGKMRWIKGFKALSAKRHEKQETEEDGKIMRKLKIELTMAKDKFKTAGTKLNQGVSQLKEKLMIFQDGQHFKRSIRVEYGNDDSDVEPDEESIPLDNPDHNYTSSMLMTELKNGCFRATFPLDALPSGDLTIRIRNYRMEIVVGRRSGSIDDSHRITCPVRYGDIDIPIYISPQSLRFRMDSKGQKLCVKGYTKGMRFLDDEPSFGEESSVPVKSLSRSSSLGRLSFCSKSSRDKSDNVLPHTSSSGCLFTSTPVVF